MSLTTSKKRSNNSARLPQFLHLTTSKTKQFSETSSKNGKLSAELTASCQCLLRFFDSTCLNYCACHEKVIPGHTKCCACHAKSSQQTWRSDAPNATRRRKSAPGPPNSSDEHVSCTAPATENRKKHLCRSSSNVPRLPSLWEMLQNPHILLTFDKVHNPMRLPREITSERPRVVRACSAFHILTSKFASRHNGVHFFDISTSKSGLNLMCFVHFDFDMCFAPEPGNFSTSQLPKVVRTWCALYILTWKCASRHNGMQFFISHLASWLRTRRFSEPTFRPSGASNHWKNTRVSRLSYLFAHLDLLSSSLLFSDSSLLCFSFVHIVGSLTSKLPSTTLRPHLQLTAFSHFQLMHIARVGWGVPTMKFKCACKHLWMVISRVTSSAKTCKNDAAPIDIGLINSIGKQGDL